MNKKFLKDMRDALEKTLEESLNNVKSMEIIIRSPKSKNEEEQADQIAVVQNATSQKRICDLKIVSIRKALRKFDEDSYGVCVSCGEDIAEKRLMAIPYTETCIDCAEVREIYAKRKA